MDLVGIAHDQLRVGAVGFVNRGTADVDAIAGIPGRHAVADGVHDARRIGARNIWKLRLDGVGAGSHVSLVGIDADGADANANLPRLRYRIRNLFELENVGPAKLTRDNRLHDYFFASSSSMTCLKLSNGIAPRMMRPLT
jgi:hypothetical protein